jgi:hypothetical protein
MASKNRLPKGNILLIYSTIITRTEVLFNSIEKPFCHLERMTADLKSPESQLKQKSIA